MATLRVMLIVPADLVREPVIYNVATRHNLVPNITPAVRISGAP